MNKLLNTLTLAVIMSLAQLTLASPYDGDDCDYRNDGGFLSRDCHVLNEERLDALEASQEELTTALNDGSLRGEKGDKGSDGKDGINGKDGLNGADGVDGINGKDFDSSRIIKQYISGIAQAAAMAQLAQAPHDQSSISLGCAGYLGATECVIGGSLYVEDTNLLLNLAIGKDIVSGSVTYHFGK